MAVDVQRDTLAAITPRKTRYPLGGPQDQCGRLRKISPCSTGI